MKSVITLLLLFNMLSLAGQNSTMTIRDVFDFQPGDVFHYKREKVYVNYPMGMRFEVLSRTDSPNNDTVCYSLFHFDYTSTLGTGGLVYTNDNYIKNVCYTNLDSLIHTTITPGWVSMFFKEGSFIDTFWCDSLVYWYEAHYGGTSEPDVYYYKYGKGLGIMNHMYNCPSC
jgi:hypothetical protein